MTLKEWLKTLSRKQLVELYAIVDASPQLFFEDLLPEIEDAVSSRSELFDIYAKNPERVDAIVSACEGMEISDVQKAIAVYVTGQWVFSK